MTELQPKPKLVSVVVINYNYACYLRASIESVLAQTYADIELVVVDDGSTDDSREILRDFADRAKLVLTSNRGQTNAVNIGFATTRGDIVMFLDADDTLCKTAIARVVASWRPTVAKIQFRLTVVDAQGRSMGYTTPPYFLDLSAQELKRMVLRYGFYATPPTSGNAYGRSFLNQVMPIDHRLFPRMPDGALNAIVPVYGDVISVDEELGSYRVHGRNMWTTTAFDLEKTMGKIAQGIKEVALLQCHAAALGLRLLTSNPIDHSIFLLEQRLMAAKLCPGHALVAGDRPLRLFWHAFRWINRFEPRRYRGVLRLVWFLATALSPAFFARQLIEYRHGERRRLLFFRRMGERRRRSHPPT
jgi:glycosyltransferase involved in cell wall biosynthesis